MYLPKKRLQNYEKKNKDKFNLSRCGLHFNFLKYFLYVFVELSAK